LGGIAIQTPTAVAASKPPTGHHDFQVHPAITAETTPGTSTMAAAATITARLLSSASTPNDP
jgi:hypothetical protein